jgi:hypothetical protein
MPLSEKHRNAIYQLLVPEWGDDVTEAFLSQFPASEADELVTRDHLRAELGLTRTELHTEIADLRAEMRSEIADLRTEMRSEIADLRTEMRSEIAGLRAEMHGQVGDLRTEMHREFSALGRQMTTWMLTGVGVVVSTIAVATTLVITLA